MEYRIYYRVVYGAIFENTHEMFFEWLSEEKYRRAHRESRSRFEQKIGSKMENVRR